MGNQKQITRIRAIMRLTSCLLFSYSACIIMLFYHAYWHFVFWTFLDSLNKMLHIGEDNCRQLYFFFFCIFQVLQGWTILLWQALFFLLFASQDFSRDRLYISVNILSHFSHAGDSKGLATYRTIQFKWKYTTPTVPLTPVQQLYFIYLLLCHCSFILEKQENSLSWENLSGTHFLTSYHSRSMHTILIQVMPTLLETLHGYEEIKLLWLESTAL